MTTDDDDHIGDWNDSWGPRPSKLERPPAWTCHRQVNYFDDWPEGLPLRTVITRDPLPDIEHQILCRNDACANANQIWTLAGPANENLKCARCGGQLYRLRAGEAS